MSGAHSISGVPAPSKHACTVSVMKRYRLPVLTSTVTVPACQYTVTKQYRYSTETGLRAHWACPGMVPQRYSSGIKMVPFLYWWCRFTVVVVQKLYNFWTDFTCYGTDVTKTVPFLYWWFWDVVPMVPFLYWWYRDAVPMVSYQIGIISIPYASTVRFWSWLYPNCRNLYRLPENATYFLCHVLHFVKCHGHVLCDFYFFIFISKPLKCLQIWIYKCNIYNIGVQSV